MAELTPKQRLQPSLLDRLTDDEPGQTEEPREKRVLSIQRLRQAVLRDLESLLNATNLEAAVDLSKTPEVARSVLNYGIPDLAGHSARNLDITTLERMLRTAIQDFEPRILRHSLRVRALVDLQGMDHNAIAFEISGELWAQPVPLSLYLKTELDLESGTVQVSEFAGGG